MYIFTNSCSKDCTGCDIGYLITNPLTTFLIIQDILISLQNFECEMFATYCLFRRFIGLNEPYYIADRLQRSLSHVVRLVKDKSAESKI